MANMADQISETVSQLNQKIAELQKTISTSDAGFPVRENLAAEAKLLLPNRSDSFLQACSAFGD